MKRIVVFAHYDKDEIIDDYVIYYINGLKQIADKIIFVSDCNLSKEEVQKLNGLAFKVIAQRHGEYDFGSYKKGYIYAQENKLLIDCDEIVFANDSCYGPMYPFDEMFDTMGSKKIDFWGATKNFFGIEYKNNKIIINNKEHIQSYFIVFRRQVFQSDFFNSFMQKITKQDDKNVIIIDYEIGMTQKLIEQGFTCASYAREYPNNRTIHINLWRELFDQRFPLIKTSILRLKNISEVDPKGWQEGVTMKSEYPIALIEKDLLRNANQIGWIKKLRKTLKRALLCK